MFESIDLNGGIEDAFGGIASFVPKFVGFLVVLLIGYFVAKIIGKAIDKVLERVGFDKAVERGGVRKALEKSKYDASDLISKIVFYTLFLFVLQLAFGVFGPNPISDLLTGVIAYLPKVVAAIIIVVVAAAIATGVKDIVGNALGGLSYGKTVANGAAAAILVIAAFAALDQLQIAPRIVNTLFMGLVALLVGSGIVAIGGGGIQPMRQRWESVLNKYDEEKENVRREVEGEEDADEAVTGDATVTVTSSTAGPSSTRRTARRVR